MAQTQISIDLTKLSSMVEHSSKDVMKRSQMRSWVELTNREMRQWTDQLHSVLELPAKALRPLELAYPPQ